MADDAPGSEPTAHEVARQAELQVILASEQGARQLAERALDRLSRLQRVTAQLWEAVTPSAVASVVVDQGIGALGASAGRVSLLRPEKGDVQVIAYSRYTRVTPSFSVDAPLPTCEVLRTGRPLFVTTHAEVLARFPRIAEFAEPIVEGALASAPLLVEELVIGAMTLDFETDREFDEDDRALLIALATQCSQALERARLYELSLMIQEDLRHSRDELAAILGGIAEGVTVQDLDGRVIYANAIAAQMSGFSSVDEFTRAYPAALRRFTLFDEAGNPFPYDMLPGRRLLRGETPEEVVIQFRDLDTGEWRWSILDAAPVTDEHGRPQMVVNIFRDITDRKRQADAADFLADAGPVVGSSLDVESSLAQLAELAVPRIADWCIIDLLEPDKQVRRVAVSHASPEDVDLADVLRGRRPDVSDIDAVVDRVLHSGKGELIVDWILSGKADSPQPYDGHQTAQPQSLIVVPLRARGRTFGTIALATTRSGRRLRQLDFELAEDLATRTALAVDNARLYREAQEQAEHQAVLNAALRETVEERDRALAELQQALRTRDEFLASASHDLKNPLATIKATAQLLDRRMDRPGGLDSTRLREGLHRVDAIATRAASLVDELLDLARMQMGQPLDLDRQPVDLLGLARDVTQEHQQATELHAVRLESAETELVGVWDERRLGRVLSNLLDNAVKYSPEGGPIVVRIRRDGDWAAVEVEDRGIGIPPPDRDRIFERFQRATNVERRIGGTGIGLASARHIVDSHGGTIAVESSEGEGARFTIRLPLK